MCPETQDFYVKINPRQINPRQKLIDAVTCPSFASMRLHHPICHMGINTQLIIALQRGMGG